MDTSTVTQIREINNRVDDDPAFAQNIEQDPVGTLQAEGYVELASAAEQVQSQDISAAEMQQAQEKADELSLRLLNDPAFLEKVEQDPAGTLQAEGLPEWAVPFFLEALAAPPEVMKKAEADVAGHLLPQAYALYKLIVLARRLGGTSGYYYYCRKLGVSWSDCYRYRPSGY